MMNLIRLFDLPPSKVSYKSFLFRQPISPIFNPNYCVDDAIGITRNQPSVIWAKLKDVMLLIEPGFDGVIFTECDQVLWESYRFLRPGASQKDLCLNGKLRDIADTDKLVDTHKSAMVCFDPGWINYYHWLLQCLPGALHGHLYNFQAPIVFPQYGSYIDSAVKPAFSESVFNDSIAKALPPSANLQLLKPGLYRFSELHYLVPFYLREHNTLFDCSFSNEYVSRLTRDFKPCDSKQRIFISRKYAANNKRLSSKEHTKLAELAADCNYKEVILEEMSFDKQVETFMNASHVLSAHGSGLSNIIFSQNLSLFEYNNPYENESVSRHHFQILSNQLGHSASVIDRLALSSEIHDLRRILAS